MPRNRPGYRASEAEQLVEYEWTPEFTFLVYEKDGRVSRVVRRASVV